MNLSEIFIRRPIATSLLMAAIALFGVVAYRALPADDPGRRCPDIGLARKMLGWHPEIPVAEGIRRTAAWLMPYCAPTSGWRADTVLPA